MSKGEIKAIIDSCLHSPGPTSHMTTDERIDSAAEAIAKLVDERPVDRVRAMAALACDLPGNCYSVPGGMNTVYCVVAELDGLLCGCNGDDDCPHIRAVEMYRGMK